jgi:hypothetical protein
LTKWSSKVIFAHFFDERVLWHLKDLEAANVCVGFVVRGLEDSDDGSESLAEDGGAAHAVCGEGLGCPEIVVVVVACGHPNDGAPDDLTAI